MADEHNFFALISRMKYIDRWALHQFRIIAKERPGQR